MRALGASEARAACIRLLATSGPQVTSQVTAALGGSKQTAINHLHDLEALGIIVGDPSEQFRAGHTVMWTLNEEALERSIAEYAAFLRGR